MGIHGFIRDLKKHFGYTPKQIRIEEMRGTKIAIDVSIWCFKAKYASSKFNTEPLKRYFTDIILNFASENIYPLFIFDGIPPVLKGLTTVKRTKALNQKKNKIKNIEKKMEKIQKIASENYDVITDNNVLLEYQKLEKQYTRYKKDISIRPTTEEIADLKRLFDLMGIPYITKDYHDAENLCSYIQKKGYAQWVLSSDSDCLISGTSNIIYDYSSKKKEYSIHYKQDIMKCLNFTNDAQLLHYAILLGTDYNDRIYGNGPVKSHNLIIHSTDNGITEVYTKYKHYTKIFNEFNYDYIANDPMFTTNYKYLSADNKKLFAFMKMSIEESLVKDLLSGATNDSKTKQNIRNIINTLTQLLK